MGLNLTDASADYRSYGIRKILPPVAAAHLVDWFSPRLSAAAAQRNYALDRADGTVIGSPSWHPEFAGLTGGSSYLISRTPDLPDQTVLMVVRSLAASAPFAPVFGAGRTGPRSYLFQAGVSALGLQERRDVGSGPVQSTTSLAVPAGGLNTWGLVVARMPANGIPSLMHVTTGAESVGPSGPRTPAADTFVYGVSTWGAPITGTLDIALAARFSKALSDEELYSMISFVRDNVAQAGIIV